MIFFFLFPMFRGSVDKPNKKVNAEAEATKRKRRSLAGLNEWLS